MARTRKLPSSSPRRHGTHLGILELLLHIPHDSLALEAHERAKHELRPNLARARNGSRDARQLANLVRPHVADPLDEREVVERQRERADRQSGGGGRVRVGVGVEVGRGVFLDEVLESAAEVGEEAARRVS